VGFGLLFAFAAAALIAVSRGGDRGRSRADAVAARTRVATAEADSVVTTTVAGSRANETFTAADTRTPPTSTTVAGVESLRGRKIVIDPGHNGGNFLHTAEINRLVNAGTLRKACDTTGTQTNSGYTEAAYTLDVARRMRAILLRSGASVIMTRSTNGGFGPCITERAAIGNRSHANVAISIHADGGPASGRGFHVIYPPSISGLTDDIATASHQLALDVREAFARGTGLPYATYVGEDGLDRRTDLGGLNLSDVPKVFIETGNMRNPGDAALLSSPAFRQREARSLALGLATFLHR
jgi:N-acetylmuramoyl-L-alanine amidase